MFKGDKMKTNPTDPTDWSQFIKSQTSIDGTVHEGVYPGLTKREYFAALAMQGLLASPTEIGSLNEFIEKAVISADKLIKELNKNLETK
jgi:hypothetical protein